MLGQNALNELLAIVRVVFADETSEGERVLPWPGEIGKSCAVVLGQDHAVTRKLPLFPLYKYHPGNSFQ